jgi:small subunit ribosomal protein S7
MRKRAAKKRPLLPDPRFNDQLVTRFVNNLMWDGKKSTAFKVFYDAMDIVEAKKARCRKIFSRNLERCTNKRYASRRSA